MITYRHHIVSLVAVFLALAIGVVLGGGPLSELGRDQASARAAERTQEARAAAGFGDQFAEATAERLYAGRLAEHPVAVLVAPGADEQTVAALTDQVALAGGSVTARYDLQDPMLDPGEKSLVDTLGSQLMTRVGKGQVDPDASTYLRLGQLLALAVATDRETHEPAGDPAVTVRDSLAGAELLVAPKGEPGRAPLVLVVLGDELTTSASASADAEQAQVDRQGRSAVLSGLLSGLADGSTGVVVAGSTRAGGAGGALADLRHEPVADELTTVDGVETGLGQVTATLALVAALEGRRGAFGAAGADGAVPVE